MYIHEHMHIMYVLVMCKTCLQSHCSKSKREILPFFSTLTIACEIAIGVSVPVVSIGILCCLCVCVCVIGCKRWKARRSARTNHNGMLCYYEVIFTHAHTYTCLYHMQCAGHLCIHNIQCAQIPIPPFFCFTSSLHVEYYHVP